MSAAGAYLLTLRERGRLSREEVAEFIRAQTGEGTNAVQVLRIEKGGHATRSAVLAAFAQFVGANPAHLQSLLAQKDSDAKKGKELAEAWLSLSADERERVLRVALATDPDALTNAIASLRRLLSAREKPPTG
jgi:transcriptional regulator with XRE-family HTH domain